MTFISHLRGPIRLRGSQLLTLCIALSPLLAQGNAMPGEFRAGFLRQHPDDAPNSGALALQALANERALGPGLLLVDLTVNLEPVGPRELRFDLDATGTHLQPCLPPGLLAELGLRTEALADPTLLAQQCLNLAEVVPGARVDFDSQRLRLAISIPQIAMRREVAGQVDPARWDAGINAAFVNYQASTLQGSSRGRGRFDSHDLYLTSGINLSGWRLRSSQAWRQDAQGERSWTRAYTYAQTDLPGTWGTLTLGETATDSDLFRGVPVTGLRLATDPEMLPDALRSYAPTIRGVAQTRAKLEIWQNGYPIYSTYVSPGPYAIDDLGVAGSGELEVVLTEADGQVRRYLQPYTALGNLLRPGIARYSFTAGHYNAAGDARSPALWQLTAARGTPWNTTLIGGLMASQGYHAQAAGLARDLGALGALAFDITHASADLGQALGGEIQGMSYALRYSKAFEHGTNLRFAGYRYSTENYRDFDEWVRQTSYDGRFRGSRRSRLEASAYQRLGSNSSLNLNFSQQDYWQRSDVQRQFQLSYNTYLSGVTVSLYASQSLSDGRYGSDRQVGLSLSMPLEFGARSNFTLDLQHSAAGTSQRASLSASHDRNLSYHASASRSVNNQQNLALNVAYQAAPGTLGAGISRGADYHSVSLNASGALLAHAGGVELGPYLGDTMALVHVPGIAGVGVHNAASQTNARGYALVPYLRPYKANSLVLDTDRLGAEIDIDNASAQVVPRRGAVVKQQFAARRVNHLVLSTQLHDGRPLPFGAQLRDSQGEALGVVGQAGQVLLTMAGQAQQVTAHWGEDPAARCSLYVEPDLIELTDGVRIQHLTCQ
ncbi:fimbrial biogenesis outer membrane usher protein [Pantoea sp. Tr-811]|uniref:fimbria/pilus outer membrane usher protein n=1 Tax=Pantoea sp. Tr-811 TaxID=2608361 RepID=UPI0014249E6E|nr:fimbria/pilus outer membrane usher protein [Pantoea sp. Tr-811]NIF30288.1 fimbrial biogenesis outer membrane usher protein [Pantoea sp. Tr-811]